MCAVLSQIAEMNDGIGSGLGHVTQDGIPVRLRLRRGGTEMSI